MSRWMGIDHGAKRIGLAVGNTEDGFAAPVTVLRAGADEHVFSEIERLAKEYHADGLVVGWPINMDDTQGPQARSARAFAAALEKTTGFDVRLWDERLSSFQADQALAGQMTRGKRKARQDAVAAAAFLSEFLQHDGPARAPKPDTTKVS